MDTDVQKQSNMLSRRLGFLIQCHQLKKTKDLAVRSQIAENMCVEYLNNPLPSQRIGIKPSTDLIEYLEKPARDAPKQQSLVDTENAILLKLDSHYKNFCRKRQLEKTTKFIKKKKP